MHVHLWCCFPEGKEPFRHTTKGLFGLGDKIDMLKEIDAYGGVVFGSQGQCFSCIVSLSSCLFLQLAPFSFIQTDKTVLMVSFLNPTALLMLCIRTATHTLPIRDCKCQKLRWRLAVCINKNHKEANQHTDAIRQMHIYNIKTGVFLSFDMFFYVSCFYSDFIDRI